MREVTELTDNKFLNIKAVKHPEMHVNGYQFAERRGVDSIAFICYDSRTNKFLVNGEYKPPTNEFIDGAFGGSLDKDVSKEEIVIAEVKEEAGFVVDEDAVVMVGRSFVSTQMNQYCYLYIVYVDREDQQEREPENAIEAMAETKWVTVDEINLSDDWKSIAIVTKAKHQGHLYV
jgi:hypothetical protein